MRGLRERIAPCPVCGDRHLFRQPDDCEALLSYARSDEGEDMAAHLVAELAMITGETIWLRVGNESESAPETKEDESND